MIPATEKKLRTIDTAATARSFPSTRSRREAGEASSVSSVPRSFFPATRSFAA
jgi:hypothetical protein